MFPDQSDIWCTDMSIQTTHISLTSGVHMCLYRLHTSAWHLVYRCVYTDSTHQSDIWCTDVSIQTPHISLISGVQRCLQRLHTSAWHLVYRCVYTDSTQQSDVWCTDVSIQTPHISPLKNLLEDVTGMYIVQYCIEQLSLIPFLTILPISMETYGSIQSLQNTDTDTNTFWLNRVHIEFFLGNWQSFSSFSKYFLPVWNPSVHYSVQRSPILDPILF
jgi:hypothetical protein